MPFPKSELGMVISCEFLWSREADKGQFHGHKDRPSVIVLNAKQEDDKTWVIVAPVTHSQNQPEYSV